MGVSIYRLRPSDLLTLCVLSLLALGVLMVESAGMRVTGNIKWSWNDVGTKQAMFAVVSAFAFLIVGRLDYAKLLRPTRNLLAQPVIWLLAISAFLCLIVLVPHIGLAVNGARRWLPLGIVQLQPSELGKWAAVIYLAYWLTEQPVDLDKFFKGFVITLVPVVLVALLIVIQDFGTAALIAICSLAMLVVGKIKWWHLAIVIPPALAAATWFITHKSYRMQRMMAFRDPWAAPQGVGYHMIQSLLSFSTGGVTGKGLGNGIQKLGYLPEDTTDFIFAVICEELGLFGALFTVAMYLGIVYVAWQAVQQKRDSFGRMLAFGIASMIAFQAMINIAVATVSVPTKGLSLPLVSAGGSGLVITCGALGLLLAVMNHEHEEEEEHQFETERPMGPISTSPFAVGAILADLAKVENKPE